MSPDTPEGVRSRCFLAARCPGSGAHGGSSGRRRPGRRLGGVCASSRVVRAARASASDTHRDRPRITHECPPGHLSLGA